MSGTASGRSCPGVSTRRKATSRPPTTVDPKALEFFRPPDEKRPLAEAGLVKAFDKLKETQAADTSAWRWGRIHNRPFPHPFVKTYDLPTVERDGGTGAVMADGAS